MLQWQQFGRGAERKPALPHRQNIPEEMTYETTKNINEVHCWLVAHLSSDNLNDTAVGKCSASTIGIVSCYSLECHNTTVSDYIYAAYVQRVMYNAVD